MFYIELRILSLDCFPGELSTEVILYEFGNLGLI